MILDTGVAALIVIGAVFTLIGSIGLARFPDFYTRLHGPTKATTLGAGALILASILHVAVQGEIPSVREVLIILFLFLTAPVSAHLVARAALVRKVHSVTGGSDTADGHRRPDDEPGADEPKKVEE
ncbi:MAG: Na+/H+ antiporter subunit G [Longimicrobiales bacterium]|nr:Na+/H+ antiporter subunit G [Longimicrobiales bacterium]